MKPFQALYFIRHNFSRVLTVLVMVALTGLLYVGGSYLSNIEVEFLKVQDRYRDFAYVNLVVSDGEGKKEAFLEEVRQDENLKLLPVGGNDFRFPTVLTFQNGDFAFSYSTEDFLWVNKRTDWVEDISLVKENTLFLTRRYAEYLGLKEGDLFTENREEAMFYYGERPYTVRYMKGDAFGACLVAEDSAANEFYHLTWSEKGNAKDFQKRLEELEGKYSDIQIQTYTERYERAKEEFSINSVIFLSILVVVTCVFFITINAVLVGIYDKRRTEFQIYESIGIPRKMIYWKVTKELMLISGMGMLLGMLLLFVTIALLNACLFAKDGLQLYYYHPWAIGSWLICNGMILIPSIFLRLRGIGKVLNLRGS